MGVMQEGFGRLWRGTNASLALAVPTVSSSLGFSSSILVTFFNFLIIYIYVIH